MEDTCLSGGGPEMRGDTASGAAKKGDHFLFQRETDGDSDHLRKAFWIWEVSRSRLEEASWIWRANRVSLFSAGI